MDVAPEQPLLSWVISQLLKKAKEVEEFSEGKDLSCRIWHDWQDQHLVGFPSDPLRSCMDALLTAFDLRSQRSCPFRPEEGDRVYYYMDSVKRDAELLINMLKLIVACRWKIGSITLSWRLVKS